MTCKQFLLTLAENQNKDIRFSMFKRTLKGIVAVKESDFKKKNICISGDVDIVVNNDYVELQFVVGGF